MGFWERVGEAIGYGLAALVLGPPAAISRSERRRVRRSFAAWCEERGAERLDAPRGILRRSLRLETSIGPAPAEVVLRVHERRAMLDVTIPPLPPWVRAHVRCEHAIEVRSDTLDAASVKALDEHVASGKLGALRVVSIEVRSERLEVTAIAMTTLEAWRAIGEGTSELADWLVERWPVGYRG